MSDLSLRTCLTISSMAASAATVTITALAPASPLLRHDIGVMVDGDITNAVPVEHRADNLPDPAVSDDDGVTGAAARRDGKFGIEPLVIGEFRRQSPCKVSQHWNKRHGDRG